LWDRSGMGAKKIVHRLAGVIDEDYRGEWFVRLVNHSSEVVRVEVGDKIVQGIYTERTEVECPIVPALPETSRGTGGFGSTDKPRPVAVPAPLRPQPIPYDQQAVPPEYVGDISEGTGEVIPPAPETEVKTDPIEDHQFDPGDDRPGDLIEPAIPASGVADFEEEYEEPPGASESAWPTTPQSSEAAEPPLASFIRDRRSGSSSMAIEPADPATVPTEAPPAPQGWVYGQVIVYDGRDAGQAMACMRDRQMGSAINWITQDTDFWSTMGGAAPRIIPETLRSVPGRQAVAFNPLIPEGE